MSLSKYISEFVADFSFRFVEHVSKTIKGISIEIDVMEYTDAYTNREKSHIVMKKDDLKYECDCTDVHDWQNSFYCITLRGKTYLCFRKTLYGFTFLNVDTLKEEYDYFPSQVLEGNESFIIVDAKSIGNIIIFDGCYWASPYFCFAYDHEKKLFLNLSDIYNINSECKFEISGGVLEMTGTNKNNEITKITVNQIEISHLLAEYGTSDF